MVLLTKSELSAPPKIRRRLMWSLPLGALLLALACVPLVVNPTAVVVTWTMQISSEGSAIESFLSKPMYPVLLSVWLFNITNAAAFQAGQDRKLKVEQVGPFKYKETRYNHNVTLDLGAGVMRFTTRSELHFARELSACADDVMLTLPNIAMLGAATMISKQNYWTRMGFNVLANQLNSQPTVVVNTSTYLWGYSDPLLTLAHNLIPGYIDFEKIGLLDKLFNETNHLEIGARNHDKCMVKKRNGLTKLPMGNLNSVDNCELCDKFVDAYEGIIYPSSATPETPINIYKNGLCRILPTEFHKKVVHESEAEGLLFNVSDRFFSLDHNATNDGLLDLSDCFYGIPLAVSKLFFEGVDPAVYERLEGMPEPDPALQSYFVIEPMIAMELESVVRVQLNLVLPDLSFSGRASSYSRLVLPLARLDFVQPPLPADTLDNIHFMYVTAPIITWAAVAVLIVAALALISHPVILYFVHKRLTTEKIIVLSTQEPLLQRKIQQVLKQ